MLYKPMPVRKYLKLLRIAGWKLEKGSIDWNLFNENDQFQCSIIVSHGKNTTQEVTAYSVQKTEKAFKQAGLKWPPIKK